MHFEESIILLCISWLSNRNQTLEGELFVLCHMSNQTGRHNQNISWNLVLMRFPNLSKCSDQHMKPWMLEFLNLKGFEAWQLFFTYGFIYFFNDLKLFEFLLGLFLFLGESVLVLVLALILVWWGFLFLFLLGLFFGGGVLLMLFFVVYFFLVKQFRTTAHATIEVRKFYNSRERIISRKAEAFYLLVGITWACDVFGVELVIILLE